jgi:uncharacterized protein
MNMKLKILVLIIFIIFVPLSVYSAVVSNNTTNITNSTNNISVLENNNLSQNSTKLLDVPNVKEPNNYSSGPAALEAVLDYYGTDVMVDELINTTNTTSENGTLPGRIVQTAQIFGFTAEIKDNMTLKDLQQNIDQGIPVIINIPTVNATNISNQNGTVSHLFWHYMVVIGIDNENIYMEDPAILGSRGYLTNQEFLDRWNYTYQDPSSGNNITAYHSGIIITGGTPIVRPLITKIN